MYEKITVSEKNPLLVELRKILPNMPSIYYYWFLFKQIKLLKFGWNSHKTYNDSWLSVTQSTDF